MASSTSRKQCANANGCKQIAAALCEGCSQALCTKHFIEHRRFLEEEMNVIVSEYDEFQYTLNQQTVNSHSHLLIKQIDEWEQESIAKIQEKAKELRQELLQITTVHLDELSKKFRHLSEKLKEGREHDSFVEIDLQDWKKTLDNLKANLASPSMFNINRNDGSPLVQNICVNSLERNELFERVSENGVQIEENGQVAFHNAIDGYIEIRGKNEYTSGCHEIRLCIEESANSLIFLGINSKLTPLKYGSYNSKSAYGWTNNNYLWLNGKNHSNTSTSCIEMKTNDIISLNFDCDKHTISMVNERTNAKYELDVNIDHCPFPWQLHVIIFKSNSRIRILPTSS